MVGLCKTKVGEGTIPANLVDGCNKFLAKHKMNYEYVTVPFKKVTFFNNIFDILKASGTTNINFRTDPVIGYQAKKESDKSFGNYNVIDSVDKTNRPVKFVDSNHLPFLVL